MRMWPIRWDICGRPWIPESILWEGFQLVSPNRKPSLFKALGTRAPTMKKPTNMCILKPTDLDSLVFEYLFIDLPFSCYVKIVSFCWLSAVVVPTKPNQHILFILVIDVEKSLRSATLVVISETQSLMTDDAKEVKVDTVLSLTQKSGACCFILRKNPGINCRLPILIVER
ncbi:hypothetical protein Pelo_10321 [Pelomyxa schiedti]|nr:hypothetical protein Pelo_10321 [Pelomyxa schiedti]